MGKDTRPGRTGWFRWLTLPEAKRIMGLPDAYDLGPTLTTAGEVLGQGVLVDVFRQIIESVAPVERPTRSVVVGEASMPARLLPI